MIPVIVLSGLTDRECLFETEKGKVMLRADGKRVEAVSCRPAEAAASKPMALYVSQTRLESMRERGKAVGIMGSNFYMGR